jgi:hypothetical protein
MFDSGAVEMVGPRGRERARGHDVTALVDRNADDEFAEAVGDAALIALLRSKPRDDEVPSSVWWLIAESLRTTVELRRCLGHQPQLAATLNHEAVLLTEAALAELAAATGARPTPIVVDASAQQPGLRPGFGLQLSVMFLARMLVSQTATTPQRLANTLAAHLRALAATRERCE